MSTTIDTDEQELTRGHAEIREEPKDEREHHSSDRVPPRPPRREEPHGPGRRPKPLPPVWALLLAIALIGTAFILGQFGGRALNTAIEGFKHVRD
jgi:hypothetical protein